MNSSARLPGTEDVEYISGVVADSIVQSSETFRIDVSIVINAEPEIVFDYVTDLTRSGEWSPECQGGSWLSGPPSRAGSVFGGRNHRRPEVVAWAPVVRGDWDTESEVVESVRPGVFRWAMRNSAGERQQSVWSFTLAPVPGGTELVHAFWMGELTEGMRGILGGLAEEDQHRFIAEWAEKLRDDLGASVSRIKSAIELGKE